MTFVNPSSSARVLHMGTKAPDSSAGDLSTDIVVLGLVSMDLSKDTRDLGKGTRVTNPTLINSSRGVRNRS